MENNRYIIIGDVHLDAPQSYEHAKGNYILDGCIRTLNYIFDYGKKIGIKKYIFLGDIFTKKDKIPNRIKNRMIDFFDRLSHYCYNIEILKGNHDEEGNELSIKFLNPFAKIITETVNQGGINFVPYKKDENELCKDILHSDAKYLLGHFEIKGSSYGSISDSKTGLSSNIFSNYSMVICGHIHRHQRLSHGIYHLGSLYQVNYGEESEGKYFCLVDNGKFIFKELPLFINRCSCILNNGNDIDLEYKRNSIVNKYFIEGCSNMINIYCNTRNIDNSKISKFKEYLKNNGFVNIQLSSLSVEDKEFEISKTTSSDNLFKDYVKDSLNNINIISERVVARNFINSIIGHNNEN